MADEVRQTVLQIRDDRGWLNVAVIDGRRYPDQESFDRAVDEMFETMSEHRIPAQFESRRVRPTEPPSRLPSWEDYRATLPPKEPRDNA